MDTNFFCRKTTCGILPNLHSNERKRTRACLSDQFCLLLRFGMPQSAQFLSAANDSRNNVCLRLRRGNWTHHKLRCDAQFLQAPEYWLQGAVFVAKENASANANERPPESFENCLAFEVFLKFFRAVKLFAVAFDCQPSPVSTHNEVNRISACWEFWRHVVSLLHQSPQND